MSVRSITRVARAAVALLAVGIELVSPAFAQGSWKPEKNVEIVVPSAAAGGTDRTARVIQRAMQEGKLVDGPVVVVNRAGGGGSIGWTYVAQHAGDAHFLAMTQPALLTNFITGASKINHTSLTPIAQISNEYVAFSVRQDSPLKSGADLLERLKKDPRGTVFGVSNALGAPGHIALAQVMRSVGIDVRKVKVVVFASGGESQIALLGGHIDVVPTVFGNLVNPLKSGRVRVLAVSAPKRLTGFAQIPTWKELGVDVVVGNWRGVAGPPKLERAQVAYWEAVFAKVVVSDEWKKDLEVNSAEPEFMTSADSRKFLDAQMEQLRRVLTDLELAKSSP